MQFLAKTFWYLTTPPCHRVGGWKDEFCMYLGTYLIPSQTYFLEMELPRGWAGVDEGKGSSTRKLYLLGIVYQTPPLYVG